MKPPTRLQLWFLMAAGRPVPPIVAVLTARRRVRARLSGAIALLALLVSGLSPPAGAQEAGAQYDTALYQGMRWRSIGPFRGGRSVAVTGVVSDPYTYYFGSVGGGVWKTEDAGDTWSNVTDGFVNTASVGAVAVARTDPNVVYVGMGEHAIRGVATSHGDGVYKSTDAGRTWIHLGLKRTRHIAQIRIHPTDPDVVYVAAQGAAHGRTEERGVYRSRDGGTTWELVLHIGETAGASDVAMDPTNPRVLYAAFWDHLREPWQMRSGGPGSGVHKSSDGGDTWTKLTDGFPELMGKIQVDVAADGNRVYAMVEADPGGGLYRSANAGTSWTRVSDDWDIRSRAWYYTHVRADPQNPDVVWVMNAPLMKSIDGGKTFTRIPTPHGDNHALWINPRDTRYVINGNDGGANVSLNGGKTWSTQRNQPTAQFYRVNTDKRFPYHVYGGQQDNSTVSIASQTLGAGIGWKDWQAVGGCESGYVEFDRKKVDLVYAGCYMGRITEWERSTGRARDIMAYPMMPVALPSREMKYRFNWNAPIVVSRHDPQVLYHAAHVLLRSEDRGRSWREVSADLTRNDKEKQGLGGGPITNEGAGGEIYNTISYVAESPHDGATIWVGSDDGLAHVTRDGGSTWRNVTPEDLGEALVNSIEVSPHDPAAAYLVATRYKFNDFTPLVYKTTDYGRRWNRIVTGIEEEAWVRVVREDPVQRGLLYAGTESGMYVSFDAGRRWQSLQLNLPVTPVTDLQVRANDLVASTQGRAFWILDDLSPLQQLTPAVARADVHLFSPRPAVRLGGGGGFGGGGAGLGENPPRGAIVDFSLSRVPDSIVTLEILGEGNGVIRTYSTAKREGADTTGSRLLKLKPGMNRVVWDLRHESVKAVPKLYVFGSLRGRNVVPGTYRVRLTAAGLVQTTTLVVRKDPRVDGTQQDFLAQDRLLLDIRDELAAIHENVNQIGAVRDQITTLTEREGELSGSDRIREAGEELVTRLTAMEDSLVQKRTANGQNVLNYPSRLNFHYIWLRGQLDGAEAGVTQGARDLFADLSAKWSRFRAEVERLLGPELTRFNDLVRQAGVPAVVVPGPRDARTATSDGS